MSSPHSFQALINNIDELLAQREQEEQEPFAWAYAQLEWDSHLEEFVGEEVGAVGVGERE